MEQLVYLSLCLFVVSLMRIDKPKKSETDSDNPIHSVFTEMIGV